MGVHMEAAPKTVKVLREAHAAERLGVGRQTLTNWRHRGIGPAYVKIGPKAVGYLEEDLLAFLEASRVVPDARVGDI